MADMIFRNVYEERGHQIAIALEERIEYYTCLFDYSVPEQLTVTYFEVEGGTPLVFKVTTKTSKSQVARNFSKALAAYDRSR